MNSTSPSSPPPTSPLRIAILEADHRYYKRALDKVGYGFYGDVFTHFLQSSATALGWDPSTTLKISIYDVEGNSELPDSLDDIDAILITGSKYDAFNTTIPWIQKLVEFVTGVLNGEEKKKNMVKVMGVCFGHQIVGRCLGGDVGRAPGGWEASVVPITLTSHGISIFDVTELSLFASHQDEVKTMPDPSNPQILGFTQLCVNHGMSNPLREQLLTVQGHPEFTEAFMVEILKTRRDEGIFTEEQFQEMMSRVGNPQDGEYVGKQMLKFVKGDVHGWLR